MQRVTWVAITFVSVTHLGCSSGGTADSLGTDAGSGAYLVVDGGGPAAAPPDGAGACPIGACNYESGEGCAATETCAPSLASGASKPMCSSAGTKTTGTCTASSECAPGFTCASGKCHKLCCGGDWSACPSAKEHCLTRLVYAGPVDTGGMICVEVDD